MPIARARAGGSGNSALTIPSATAAPSDPPRPWTKRAAASQPEVGATAQATEAAENAAMPQSSTRRRPTRSPMRPASSSRPPNPIRYASTTHDRPSVEKPRSRWMLGSATATTVSSTIAISVATHTTASASRRPRGIWETSMLRSVTDHQLIDDLPAALSAGVAAAHVALEVERRGERPLDQALEHADERGAVGVGHAGEQLVVQIGHDPVGPGQQPRSLRRDRDDADPAVAR